MGNLQHRHDRHGAPPRPSTGSTLPLAIRQRLWDQLWTRLLAPPVKSADKAPIQGDFSAHDGGQR